MVIKRRVQGTAEKMTDPVEWVIEDHPIEYSDAVRAMEERVAAVREGAAPELVRLLEHPPLYTAGTGAVATDLLDPNRFPVHLTGRGGKYTYHGPGQRVCYLTLDLASRGRDVRAFVHDVEEWVIGALARLDIPAGRREGRVGVWVDMADFGGAPGDERKIAAIGVRVRRWVTYHGASINLDPDLDHFAGIVPCGIAEHGVTSIRALERNPSMSDLDGALRSSFEGVFHRSVFDGTFNGRVV